jgi:hypothetical protein
MARGSKAAYTSKQKRQAQHIEEGYEQRGVRNEEAERRAWATVNKISGGGKKAGSGRRRKGSGNGAAQKSGKRRTGAGQGRSRAAAKTRRSTATRRRSTRTANSGSATR